jgi:RNA polymerase sigma-70 factor (ECF subfamily)
MPPHVSEATDESLLKKVQKGDGDAWRRLEACYRPLLMYWAARGGVSQADLPDHVQNVFTAVFRALPSFSKYRPGGGSFRGWLLIISGNFIADYFRKKRKRPEVPLPDEIPWKDHLARLTEEENSPRPPSRKILARQIEKMIRTEFDEKTWTAFMLLVVEELDATEVGKRLGKTPHAVRKAKSRVLKQVKSEFGDMSPWA